MKIDELLKLAAEMKASDLHLKVGNHPYVRTEGELKPLDQFPRVSSEIMLGMAFSMMNNRQKQKFKESTDLDMAYGVAGLGRFRVNVFQQRGNIGMSIRLIPTKVKTIEELELPKIVDKLAQEQRGMVLVTGTTGSGKSTTLAALIDRINVTRTDHVITIEDPIEFLHRDKEGVRQPARGGSGYGGFRRRTSRRTSRRTPARPRCHSGRRDARSRDHQYRPAGCGNRSPGSLHFAHPGCQRDYPAYHRRLSSPGAEADPPATGLRVARDCLAAAGSQGRGKGPVPAVEVLITTQFIRECIINPDKTRMIREAIASGTSQYGMQTFDQSIYDLYSRGLITYEEALLRASNVDEFKLRVEGISSTSDLSRMEMEQVLLDSEIERSGQE